MPAACTRLVNFRFRGPLESRKVNQMRLDLATDLEFLAKASEDLARRLDETGRRITTGEYVDVREAGTLP